MLDYQREYAESLDRSISLRGCSFILLILIACVLTALIAVEMGN